MLLIRPSTENIFKELVSIATFVFIVLINSEKQISLLNRFLPRLLIAKEILEFKSSIISTIKNEKFIQLAKIIDDRIYRDYKLFKNNYIAHDLLNKSYRYENHYSKEDKESFIQYKNNGLSQLNGDYDELEQIFLKIYATPVDNCERFKKH